MRSAAPLPIVAPIRHHCKRAIRDTGGIGACTEERTIILGYAAAYARLTEN